MKLTFIRIATTLLLLPNSLFADGAHFVLVKPDVIETRLNSLSRDDAEREVTLKRLFIESGCIDHISEALVKHVKLPNLICILPGETEKVILVGAHFDHARVGDGAVDNWSGASLLPSLYQSIKATSRRHTFVFIAFTAEEQGLVGSHFYVTQMSAAEVARTQAMINLDSLGLGPTAAWVSHADPYLAGLLGWTAKALNLPIERTDVEAVGSSDSEEFRKRKIPSLTVHSVTQQTLSILHHPADKVSAIHMTDYYNSYHLLAGYLAILDDALGRPDQPSPPTNK
jgi:Peptidase family M28